MSGGSYDYLCHAYSVNGVGGLAEHRSQLEAMAERLSGLGYAEDAARETCALLAALRHIENMLHITANRLEPVWRAVEWWDSCDSSEDQVKGALEKYRQKTLGRVMPES